MNTESCENWLSTLVLFGWLPWRRHRKWDERRRRKKEGLACYCWLSHTLCQTINQYSTERTIDYSLCICTRTFILWHLLNKVCDSASESPIFLILLANSIIEQSWHDDILSIKQYGTNLKVNVYCTNTDSNCHVPSFCDISSMKCVAVPLNLSSSWSCWMANTPRRNTMKPSMPNSDSSSEKETEKTTENRA